MQKTKASVRDESAHIDYKQMSEIFDPRNDSKDHNILMDGVSRQ